MRADLPGPGGDEVRARGAIGVDFVLFLLVNVALFLRPAEIIPALVDVPVYEILIVSCLVVALPKVLAQLSDLSGRPITACVVGLLVAVVLSHLSHFDFWRARFGAFDFLKIVLYYLLLVGVVDSPDRLKSFLGWLVGLIAMLAMLAVLQYDGIISIASLEMLERTEIDPTTGKPVAFLQLRGTGIFKDPNDISLILLVGMASALYRLGDRSLGSLRLAFLAPLGLLGYALSLTKSRGGFLALLATTLVLFHARYGLKRSIVLGAVVLPLMLVAFGGRQTRISSEEGTAQERMQLWSTGLQLMREAPLFGIGQGLYGDRAGKVAHNSFVHAFTELGFFGGTLFLGAFLIAGTTLYRLGGPGGAWIPDPEMRRLRPYLLSNVAAYAAGMFTLSRNYVVPTYLVLGLVAAYLRVSVSDLPGSVPRFNVRLAILLALASVAALAFFHVFVRVFVRWG